MRERLAALIPVCLLLLTVERPPRAPGPLVRSRTVHTDRGAMDLEAEYIPGVVDCEIAHFTAAPAALDAQAIAARTYVLRYLEHRGPRARVPTGPSFQCWRAPVHQRSRAAARRTTGQVVRFRGRLINANYAAGTMHLDDECRPVPGARDRTAWTQRFVTDNLGRRGDAVWPTTQGAIGPPNRGSLGQHQTICLAERLGWDATRILRRFYGEDAYIGP